MKTKMRTMMNKKVMKKMMMKKITIMKMMSEYTKKTKNHVTINNYIN